MKNIDKNAILGAAVFGLIALGGAAVSAQTAAPMSPPAGASSDMPSNPAANSPSQGSASDMGAAPGGQSMPSQSMPSQSMPGQSMPGQPMPGQSSAGQPMADPGAASSQGGMASPPSGGTGMASASGGTTMTNGPIPDTPENRAKYGKPMSHAGKKSPPKGN